MTAAREDLGGLLARATRRVIDAERPILERHGLLMWEYVVLSRLATGAAATQAKLAHDISHDPTRLINVLDRLESAGLITRRPDPSDRRARVVEISAAGRKRHGETQGEIHAMEDALLESVPARERQAYERVLRGLARGD